MNLRAQSRITGVYRRNPRGFGFLTPEGTDGTEDLYVSGRDAEGLISGDTVSAVAARRGKRDGEMRYQARDLVLLKRGRTRFVGELQRQSRRWMVLPDGRESGTAILVADPSSAGGRPGDQVVVELPSDVAEDPRPFGRIVRVLGRRGDPGVDTASIIEQYELPCEFDEAARTEAESAAESFNAEAVLPQREDLRSLTVVTIDPPTAKDFDDAVSIVEHPDGTTELGVHIADVAYFVPAGGALDRAARERSTSVYLSNTVIPMLPEALSNDVCSLHERVDRLTKSVLITYGPRGSVRKTRFANTVIRSTKRLTYAEVGRMLDGDSAGADANVVALVGRMAKLAGVIRKRRLRAGMLVLALPEAELVLDECGRAVGAAPADAGFAHTIIEMFMVEANEAVARVLTKNRAAFLRRVHPEPATTSWGNLSRFLGALGHKLRSGPDRKVLQEALDHFHDRPEVRAVHLAVLRSMQKAHYAPGRDGHYALASRDYCHFTSPIRRYPDLTVHRLLESYITGQDPVSDHEDLKETGAQCSSRERRAEAAEQELRLVLMLRLLADRGDEIYEGIVTGVAKSGLFVQLEGLLVEGRLPFDNLRQDRWRGDPDRACAVGVRSGRRIAVGDALRVRVGRIDLPARQLELTPAGPLPKAPRRGVEAPGGRQSKKALAASGGRRGRNDRRRARRNSQGRRRSARNS